MKLKNVSVSALRRELQRREAGATKLQVEHAALSRQIAALEAELADLGVDAPARRDRKPGRPAAKRGPGRPSSSKSNLGKVGRPKGSKSKGGGRRAKNALSLVEAILKGVRAGSTVSPAEAGAAAKKVGYKSSSPNFGMMVANALSKDSRFKRLERGQYQVVGGGNSKPASKAAAMKPARKPKRAKRKPSKTTAKAKPAATAEKAAA